MLALVALSLCIFSKRNISLQYFKKSEKKSSVLPNPDGPLSDLMPASAIASANKEVERLLAQQDGSLDAHGTTGRKRGRYHSFTEKEKARIAKRAAEYGVTNAIKHFSKEFVDRQLKESTVREWVAKYKKEVAQRFKLGKSMEVNELPEKTRGHPCLLGRELDNQLQEYVKGLREGKSIINSAIVMSAAMGIVKSHNSDLLEVNGGHIRLSKEWSKSFLSRMGFVKRKATTKASVSEPDFKALKDQFLFDIQTIIEMEEIPKVLQCSTRRGAKIFFFTFWFISQEPSVL